MNKTPLVQSLELLMKSYRDEEHPSGINDTQLALALNRADPDLRTTQTKIWRVTSGASKNPRRDTLLPIANFFGVTVDQLHDQHYIREFVSEDNEARLRAAKRNNVIAKMSQLDEEIQDHLLEQMEGLIRLAERS